MSDADRIGVMADEAGQTALFAVTRNAATLDQLANGYARGAWLLLHAPAEFEHAEQVRYTDDRRYGRMWDGFVTEPGHIVVRASERLEPFLSAWRQESDSPNVEIEICDRCRSRLGKPDQQLVQIAVYREGRASERKTFVEGRLDRLPDRPVVEAAITYESASGVIEVVASSRDTRKKLGELFAEHLLGTSFTGERLAMRQYSLSGLRNAFAFPTDPEDNIESVRIVALRLMPFDTAGERVTLECMRGVQRTIWQMSAERFGEQDPLRGSYAVTQARLVIKFRSVPGATGSRTLPLTITMSQGCDLKDRTEREMLIGTKYLKRWGLLQNV